MKAKFHTEAQYLATGDKFKMNGDPLTWVVLGTTRYGIAVKGIGWSDKAAQNIPNNKQVEVIRPY